jgi:hypothetical protein
MAVALWAHAFTETDCPPNAPCSRYSFDNGRSPLRLAPLKSANQTGPLMIMKSIFQMPGHKSDSLSGLLWKRRVPSSWQAFWILPITSDVFLPGMRTWPTSKATFTRLLPLKWKLSPGQSPPVGAFSLRPAARSPRTPRCFWALSRARTLGLNTT